MHSELQKRFKFDDPVYNILPMVKPTNARKLNPQSLSGLFKRYPILLDKVKADAHAEREWRDHVNFQNSYVSEDHEFESMDVEFYWNRVFSAKYPSGFCPRFPNLKVCIILLLPLPFSNAPAERCSRNMLDTKPPKKNSMKDETVDAVIKRKRMVNSQKQKSGTVAIPAALLERAKKEKVMPL